MLHMAIPQAHNANTCMVFPAEELYNLIVFPAHPILKAQHWVDQLVPLKGLNCAMWLQVTTAVRGQTNQAGFDSLLLHPMAEVTRHLLKADR